MKLTATCGALATALVLSLSASAADQAMAVAKGTVAPGDGNSVTLKGNAMPLTGTPVRVGEPLPTATLVGGNLAPVNIADAKGKIRIINVVPSLDTPVCDAQTHELAEKDPALAQNVEMVTVSMDLPFAQARWARAAKVKGMTFLSDYQKAEFGLNNGLLIQPLRLLARAVIVTDKDGVVRYLQVVPEVTELPDMQAAMDAAKGLM
ncbi:MAG TPA: thiol peroxidase [Steroidobacteraceae bacterium]|jgi:thiol peroxidase|nr:thiol peroxidase [Steroidobacteraceae bacterium]